MDLELDLNCLVESDLIDLWLQSGKVNVKNKVALESI